MLVLKMEEKASRNIKNHQNGTDRVENASNVQSNKKNLRKIYRALNQMQP